MQAKATTVLCIFVKSPVAGQVKTRLVPSVTPTEAAELAGAFFADTLALARSYDRARVVVVCDGNPAPLALDAAIAVWPQGDGDLGERSGNTQRRSSLERTRQGCHGTSSTRRVWLSR